MSTRNEQSRDLTELPREDILDVIHMYLGDVLVHYGMWFTEAFRALGPEDALALEKKVLDKYGELALNRLGPYFGIEADRGLNRLLAGKSKEDLLMLVADIAKTWVTGDGIWFQALESARGMETAKEVNDTCWSHFARMEAFKIRQFLGMERDGGLPALEKALKLRIYSSINSHACSWEKDGSLLFTMTECRVQSARRRKQMEDYPCKSAGMVEYVRFTEGIDPRIRVECVWCPPDRVPDQEFCTWRFKLEPALSSED
jgi:hypothetical protein